MHALLADLVALLRLEMEQYRRLLTLVRLERGHIVKGELAGLSEVVRKKEAVARKLCELEAARASLLDRLAAELNEPPASLSLARVAQLAPGESGETLSGLLSEFRILVSRLVAANDVNRNLLERSLEFVQDSLALFRTVIAPNPTYGANGRMEAAGTALAALNQTA
ncbi:MAG TPA: flagellar protein FlgN [Candidatus Methylomirabilis sp.]|nr:flagellar protein FlgN [Candidatus Methylomirabilis sp.]